MKIYLSLPLFYMLAITCWGQIIQIPDPNFKQVLLTEICVDINNDGLLDGDADLNNNGEIEINEASQAISLIIYSAEISDLTGIQYFVNIESLACNSNSLTNLDVSANTRLKFLRCERNQLSNLVLTNLTELETLLCYENMLTNLDISASKKLKSLEFHKNNISSINLTGLDSCMDWTVVKIHSLNY